MATGSKLEFTPPTAGRASERPPNRGLARPSNGRPQRPPGNPSRWGYLSSLSVIFGALLLVLCAGCQCKTNSSIKEKPGAVARRVVTLTPSLTEILFALDAGDRVVGVSDYCDYPAEAKNRPRVGSFLQPSVEKILALRPDLVLVDAVQKEVATALAHAGARVRAIPLNDLGDVRTALITVGEALGDRREQAILLRTRLDQELLALRVLVGKRPPRRALFVVDRQLGGLRGLVVAGPGSYLDELLRMAGGENVVADLKLRYAKIAAETITERRPEVILDAVHIPDAPGAPRASPGAPGVDSAAQAQARADWQKLADVPAVQRGAVYVLAGREFVTPGPRLGQALRRIAQLLHPEAFAPPAPPAGPSPPAP